VACLKVSHSHCIHCVSSTQHIDTFLLLQDVSNNLLIPITGPPSEQTSLMMNKLNISSYNHLNYWLPLCRSPLEQLQTILSHAMVILSHSSLSLLSHAYTHSFSHSMSIFLFLLFSINSLHCAVQSSQIR